MQKKTFVLHVTAAVALCAVGFAAPASADGGPTPPPTPRPGIAPSLPRTFAPLDAVVQYAASVATATSTATTPATATAAAAATPAPPRAAPAARSYPRTFATYDALVDYATGVAAAEHALNDRLAAVKASEDATRAALATVFDPRVRGGLLKSPSDVMDETTVHALQTKLASDAAAAQKLAADGAVATAPTTWQLPLVGEDSQDFGPTPYYFEPSLTYRGVYYPHFHTGVDIATAWGTPIVAPAPGLVVFAGTMMDGAEVVMIAHDSGRVSMYAHLDNHVFPVPVKAGDTVKAGDPIGNVGLTGITTGAHLHWSVWQNGELVDPLSMIRGE
jgi:murein DD-endopeptidase MepM/ murein hydrolase activator NlpD